MRLREIQSILQASVEKLNIQATQIPNTNPAQYQLTGVMSAVSAIKNVETTGLFDPEIEKLRTTSILTTNIDTYNVSASEYNLILTGLGAIRQKVYLLFVGVNKALRDQPLTAEVISIKIEALSNLSNLLLIIEKLKKVIELPLNEYDQGGEVEIVNFDSGSYWIDILLPTAGSVTLIGSIAWAGAVIYKKYQEANAFKHYAGGLQIQKEHLESLKEAAKKKIDLDIEAEAKLIQNEYFTSNDNEQLSRLKLSIREYSELIGKGVEIHSSLVAPENISNLFPNYKTIDLIESKVKQIANG